MEKRIKPVGKLQGETTVPGDKSISHRAIMLGSLSEGATEIMGFLPGQDCFSTLECFREMGVKIDRLGKGELRIEGEGLLSLTEPGNVLDAGNSGTTVRLLSGILAGQDFYSVINGDKSIRRRPMDRVINPLKQMGANMWARSSDSLCPISIKGSGKLNAISYNSPVSSAQVKSAVLFAGMFAEGWTTVFEPELSRDHTERMARAFGAETIISRTKKSASIKGFPKLFGQQIRVPGDISSAAFFMVAGCLVNKSEIMINNVGINPTRSGVIDVLESMGARIEINNKRDQGGEPTADIAARSGKLNPVTIEGSIIPRLIDEIPVIAVASCFANGRTVIKDAQELRVKETDRISAVVSELNKLGASVEERRDGLIIEGPVKLKGSRVRSYGDHRIAMALAVAGLAAEGETIIEDTGCVEISFPDFFKILNSLFV